MVERVLSKKRYLIAFILTFLVFFLGILLGSFLNEIKYKDISILTQEFRTKALNFDVQGMLLREGLCTGVNVDTFDRDLIEISGHVQSLEDQLGKQDDQVVAMKEYYFLLEIRHWLFLKKLREDCNSNYDLILYFYSNDEEKCESCEGQGYILSYLRQKYDNIRIYSFDVDVDNPTVKLLIDLYSVKQAPSIALNERLYTGFQERDALENALLNKGAVGFEKKNASPKE